MSDAPQGRPTETFGAWSPGLSSTIPRDVLPLSTMFRSENVFTSLAEAEELARFSGLSAHDLVLFRPERLVVHELLIRVTSDLSVSSGRDYSDLGINFRRMTTTIMRDEIDALMPAVHATYDQCATAIRACIERELANLSPVASAMPIPISSGDRPDHKRIGLARWFGFGKPRAPSQSVTAQRATADVGGDLAALARWERQARVAELADERAAYLALYRAGSVVAGRQGRLGIASSIVRALAERFAINARASEAIGALIQPAFRRGAVAAGFRMLPAAVKPVVMNVKGASASGKSTTRHYQRDLAQRLGLSWADFALISPDIWRKYLLDYQSLGAAVKYAGMLAGHELEIVDQKLDRYMAGKAAAGRMSHLLIDRFRFDSFARAADEDGSNLLSRFGSDLYMFFMITPPEATVERAWLRGLKVGRYKAVDDLLAHNVEAFLGMPRLFFTWAARTDKRVNFEFLDNTVAAGDVPRTVAFGDQTTLHLLDLRRMMDIDRFHKINVEAGTAAEVYPDARTFAAEANTQFLRQCLRDISRLVLAEQATGAVYGIIVDGKWIQKDSNGLARAAADPEVRVALDALGLAHSAHAAERSARLEPSEHSTIGSWGYRI
jgi:hypothetical protein